MKRKHLKISAIVVLTFLLLGILATTAYAANHNEIFEAQTFYTNYSEPKDGVFSLTYLSWGGGSCDWNDRRFRVNVNYSSNYSDWKFYSNNSGYQRLPSGRQFKGYSLNTTSAHVCIGASEFWPSGSWTHSGVEQNVYVWRK
jgi:hypothetical protein